jgi:hypothetical protein
MSARPQERLDKAEIRPYTVLASHEIKRGMPVKRNGDDIEQGEATTENCIGVAWDAPQWPAVAGDAVDVVLLGGGTVFMRVGTAAAVTAGAPVCFDTDGITNAPLTATAGSAAAVQIYGQALDGSSTAGELVGVNVGLAGWVIRPAT